MGKRAWCIIMTGGMEDVNRIAEPCRELLQRFAA